MFAGHIGKKRNLPIIRFGNISLMPYEKIPLTIDPITKTQYIADAYLVECRSRGGLSGSPVFAYFPATRDAGKIMNYKEDDVPLLGLVHGHYRTDIQDQIIATSDDLDTIIVNAGIAMVVPAQDILDTLMQEDVMKDAEKRLKKIEERLKKSNPGSQPDTVKQEDDFLTKEEWEETLKKIARPLKKDGEEKKET
jgi:hypothetical protein